MCPHSLQAGASPIMSPRTSCTVVTELEVACAVSTGLASLTSATGLASLTSATGLASLTSATGSSFFEPFQQVLLTEIQKSLHLLGVLEQYPFYPSTPNQAL